MAHQYDVGTGAWQPDPTEGWIASVVKEKLVQGDRVKLVFRLANEEVTFQALDRIEWARREGRLMASADQDRRDHRVRPPGQQR